ncbi:DUF370 domain-containing protein [Pueribacillus theae]|uniref:DUF370 domain-containing protein n=1 Tax=Pueribacillus theae TaxID=2171751 RepID=A0A2U1K3F5_9BACI|nr:extracellular matrix/biofilm biosynthesis regulator RemA family protein [Pueribacillus theae]PWA12070.1 DUF370 domain-containing protein [Pueribacillus theae]
MFIHLGEDVVIRANDVVAILDWQLSDNLNDCVKRFKEKEKLVDIGKNLTKSIVVTNDTLYLSPLSSLTLKRRAQASIESQFAEYIEEVVND